MSNSTNKSGGMGLGGVTWIVLMILKIAGVIPMHWFWVLTSFIWATVLWIVVVLVIIALLASINSLFK